MLLLVIGIFAHNNVSTFECHWPMERCLVVGLSVFAAEVSHTARTAEETLRHAP